MVPCCSGPKRPQDRIPVSDMKKDFEVCLEAKVRSYTLIFYTLKQSFTVNRSDEPHIDHIDLVPLHVFH